MKSKFTIIVFSTILFLACFSSYSLAADVSSLNLGEDTTSFKITYPEITDLDILYERARSNINDVSQEDVKKLLNASIIQIDGVPQDVEPLITVQLLSKSVYENGDEINNLAATLITNVRFDPDINSLRAYYSKTEVEETPGKLARLYTTIYYTTGTLNGVEYIRLTEASARSDFIDTTCRIQYTKVRGGYRGWDLNTGTWTNYTSPWSQSPGFTSSINISGAYLEYTSGGILYDIWGEGYCLITRGSQSWGLTCIVREAGVGTPF